MISRSEQFINPPNITQENVVIQKPMQYLQLRSFPRDGVSERVFCRKSV